MNVKQIPTKFKLILVSVALLIIITSALVINREKMASKIEDNKFSALPVTVTTLKNQSTSEKLSIIGNVNADNDVSVISETQGKVLKIDVKIGDSVNAGTLIAKIDDELKQAAYLTAKGAYEKAKKDLQRMENLYKENYISDSDLENARLNAISSQAQFIVAQRQFNDTKIKSPISGVVSDKFINIGTTVSPGSKIVDIVDISKLRIRMNIQEADIFKIKNGSEVTILSDVYPNISYKGKIDSISAKGDENHAFPVEIVMINPLKNPLKAGMSVKVEFSSLGDRNIYTIPRVALLGSIKNPQVYVVEENKAKLKNIVIGNEYGTDIEIVGGLKQTDKIVISGQANLIDNVEVTIQN